jgi:hypothetical protein
VIFRDILDSPLDLKSSDHVAVFDPDAMHIIDALEIEKNIDISPFS